MTARAVRSGRAAPALLPALAALTVLASFGAGAVVLLRQSALMVHQCVSAGSLGRFGVSLALLREEAACPAGSYGVGDGQRVIGVVVAVALPVLVAHLVGAGLGIGLMSWLSRLVRLAVAVVRGLRPRPAEPVAVPLVRTWTVDVAPTAPRTRAVPGGPWWRGPPVLGIA